MALSAGYGSCAYESAIYGLRSPAQFAGALGDSVLALDSPLFGEKNVPPGTHIFSAAFGSGAYGQLPYALRTAANFNIPIADGTTAGDSAAISLISSPPSWRIFRVSGLYGKPALAFKTPNEDINFGIDWSQDLGSDLIASSVWSSSPSDLTFIGGITTPATGTRVSISGGDAESEYVVTNTITTAAGNMLQDSFRLVVEPYNFIPQ